MDIFLWVFCVDRKRFLRRSDYSSRGVPPNVVRRLWSRNLMNGVAIARVRQQRQKQFSFWRLLHWLPLYLARRMSEVKDGTSRQTDPPYLEDVSRPHRRRNTASGLRRAWTSVNYANYTKEYAAADNSLCCAITLLPALTGNGARTARCMSRSGELEK